MRRYTPDYLAHFSGGSAGSAEIVLPLVAALVDVTSVADFGCGTGTWLAVWQRLGVQDVVGCDGTYVDVASLAVDPSRFIAADLERSVRLGRRFDLVQSLEVAEHLPAPAARVFVDTLVAHASIVLFSAAQPGQGGEHHVNEQPLEYWRALFRERGFSAVDAIRPSLASDTRVEPWYRYNSLLFVADSHLALCRRRVVPDGVPLRDYASSLVRIRSRLLSRVPEPIVTWMAARVRRFSLRKRA